MCRRVYCWKSECWWACGLRVCTQEPKPYIGPLPPPPHYNLVNGWDSTDSYSSSSWLSNTSLVDRRTYSCMIYIFFMFKSSESALILHLMIVRVIPTLSFVWIYGYLSFYAPIYPICSSTDSFIYSCTHMYGWECGYLSSSSGHGPKLCDEAHSTRVILCLVEDILSN